MTFSGVELIKNIRSITVYDCGRGESDSSYLFNVQFNFYLVILALNRNSGIFSKAVHHPSYIWNFRFFSCMKNMIIIVQLRRFNWGTAFQMLYALTFSLLKVKLVMFNPFPNKTLCKGMI